MLRACRRATRAPTRPAVAAIAAGCRGGPRRGSATLRGLREPSATPPVWPDRQRGGRTAVAAPAEAAIATPAVWEAPAGKLPAKLAAAPLPAASVAASRPGGGAGIQPVPWSAQARDGTAAG